MTPERLAELREKYARGPASACGDWFAELTELVGEVERLTLALAKSESQTLRVLVTAQQAVAEAHRFKDQRNEMGLALVSVAQNLRDHLTQSELESLQRLVQAVSP